MALSLIEQIYLAENGHKEDNQMAKKAASKSPDSTIEWPSNNEFEILDHIPIPTNSRGARESKYPWDKLKPSQSFFIPGDRLKTLATAVANRNKKHKETKFVVRKHTHANGVEGVMVWRTN